LKTKLKDRHFDTIEVIRAESQAVLNTLKYHTISRMHLKNCRGAGNGAYAPERAITRLRVASRPKVSF
jgi:hypothetical protein